MNIRISLITAFLCLAYVTSNAQYPGWQQRVEYKMDVKMNVSNHNYEGTQSLVYYNNSPDTLTRVFYHLFFNAFQPGSMMDVRSRTIADPDRRVMDRIAKLSPDEYGRLEVRNLKQDGKSLKFNHVETILEVELAQPLLPGKKAKFDMEFTGQVPVQIRRSGRYSSEGVAYSMSQWYPKMAQYDHEGWHANPYVGREFHPIWGDFDVKITIDSAFTIGGTGYLQNPQEIGKGYEKAGTAVKRPKGKELTWHFKAPNVHDFMWGADPEYVHTKAQVPNGPELHFFYKKNENTKAWEQLPEYTVKAFQIMNERFGVYPWEQFSVVQGGDGGMEYPMSTLITGHRSLTSLVGVTVHELAHSWFQGALAFNESLYPWMDEGYTSYATDIVMNELFGAGRSGSLHAGSYNGYFNLVASGLEEPLTTHADHYQTNRAYGTGSYSKGSISLHQLSYIIGQADLDKGMLRFFNTWKFKHPGPMDFKRVMEKVSGMELDWYYQYWVNTTHTIDYGIKSLFEVDGKSMVTLERIGKMPMPIDLFVELTDGSIEYHYIPMVIMRGRKTSEYTQLKRHDHAAWPWVETTYTVELPYKAEQIKTIAIDPSERMADIDKSNNIFDRESLKPKK